MKNTFTYLSWAVWLSSIICTAHYMSGTALSGLAGTGLGYKELFTQHGSAVNATWNFPAWQLSNGMGYFISTGMVVQAPVFFFMLTQASIRNIWQYRRENPRNLSLWPL